MSAPLSDPSTITPPAPVPGPPAAAPAAPVTPPWGDDFDAAKAWSLVENLRADKAKLSGREVLTEDAKAKLAEYDKVVEAQKTEAQRNADALTAAQATAEAASVKVQAANLRIARAEVKAAASDRFIDAEVPFAYLDAASFVQDDGDIDSAGIEAALVALLASKPSLARSSKTLKPNPAQGAGGQSFTAGQQADEALAKGDYKASMRLKADMLRDLSQKAK